MGKKPPKKSSKDLLQEVARKAALALKKAIRGVRSTLKKSGQTKGKDKPKASARTRVRKSRLEKARPSPRTRKVQPIAKARPSPGTRKGARKPATKASSPSRTRASTAKKARPSPQTRKREHASKARPSPRTRKSTPKRENRKKAVPSPRTRKKRSAATAKLEALGIRKRKKAPAPSPKRKKDKEKAPAPPRTRALGAEQKRGIGKGEKGRALPPKKRKVRDSRPPKKRARQKETVWIPLAPESSPRLRPHKKREELLQKKEIEALRIEQRLRATEIKRQRQREQIEFFRNASKTESPKTIQKLVEMLNARPPAWASKRMKGESKLAYAARVFETRAMLDRFSEGAVDIDVMAEMLGFEDLGDVYALAYYAGAEYAAA